MNLKLFSLALMAMLLLGCTVNPADTAPSIAKPGNKTDGIGLGKGGGANGGASAGENASGGGAIFTFDEVAKHSTKEDCWMVIDGKILDLSAYTSHPGGETYVPYCGTDGTQAFNDKGGTGKNHSSSAFAMIGSYVIGEIGKPMPGQGGGGTIAGNQSGNGTGLPANQGGGAANPPPSNNSGAGMDSAPAANGTASLPPQLILTMEEVARHSSASDCWMVIYGNVLNLTSFVSHPGGSTYLPYCGTEATGAYDTKGGRGNPHSSAANADLSLYTIGVLGQPQNRTVDAANTTISGGGGEDDDWENGEEEEDD